MILLVGSWFVFIMFTGFLVEGPKVILPDYIFMF
jgi:hypothetical protein